MRIVINAYDMENSISMTTTQLQRHTVLSQLIDGHMNGTEAAEKLGLTVRHIKRLKKRLKAEGALGLLHGNRGKQSGRRIKDDVYTKTVAILKETYADCKPTFASEKLAERHTIRLSRETVRTIMTKEGLWKPKSRRDTPQYRSKRPRMDMRGSMEQYDGSYHVWIEALGEEVCLLASIDDATGRITRAHFDHHEGVVPTFTFWRGYAEEHGCLPKRLYVDKFSTYKVNHKHAQDDHTMVTQFERALKALGVELICAHSPQAKGRIERLFKTLQDRLVKELRYAGITTIEEANRFLVETFIPTHNAKFAIPAQTEGDARVPIPSNVDLASAFAEHHTRQVQNDFTVRFENKWYQIEKVQSVTVLRKDTVRMEKRLDGTTVVYHERRGAYLKVTCVPERPQRVRESQVIPATTRTPYVPATNHPWRRFSACAPREQKNTETVLTQV
jgi:hypothetical protein